MCTKFKQSSNVRIVPNFWKADFPNLKKDLIDTFNKVLEPKPVEEMWVFFSNALKNNIKKYIPFCRKNRVRVHNPMWFTSEVKRAHEDKQFAFKEFKIKGDEVAKEVYAASRRNFKYLLRNSKRGIEQKLAKDITVNPKAFFAYASSNNASGFQIGSIKSEGKLITDNQEIAKVFNKFFVGVFTKGDISNLNLNEVNTGEIMEDIEFSKEDIIVKIKKMKITKAPGPDDLYPRVLVEVADIIGESLYNIFRASIDSGFIPVDWKYANVIPIYKKGDKSDPNNFRPISLTSVVGKVLESLIKIQIENFIESNGLFSKFQYGFRKGRSCVTNLLDFYDGVTRALDNGDCVDIVYIDFQKAFDKVPHNAILFKLRKIGIRGKLWSWVANWLKGRKQRVVINGQVSNWANVDSGVPQGSVLGPLLFLIFINDLVDGIHSTINQFADDVKIMRSINKVEDVHLLQNDLDSISSWALKWGMSINISKSQVLHLGRKNLYANYRLQQSKLEKSSVVRDLGVLVSNSFKMDSECSHVYNKANRMLGFIKKSITSRDRRVIMPLYKSLVRPQLEYAVQFWSPYYQKDIANIERVQKRATKLIDGLQSMDYEDRLRSLNLYSLKQRRLRGDLIQVFKLLRGIDINNSVDSLILSHNEVTRGHRYKLCKNFSRLDLRHFYFFNRIVDHWNGLPTEVVESDTVDKFKLNLDKFWGLGLL